METFSNSHFCGFTTFQFIRAASRRGDWQLCCFDCGFAPVWLSADVRWQLKNGGLASSEALDLLLNQIVLSAHFPSDETKIQQKSQGACRGRCIKSAGLGTNRHFPFSQRRLQIVFFFFLMKMTHCIKGSSWTLRDFPCIKYLVWGFFLDDIQTKKSSPALFSSHCDHFCRVPSKGMFIKKKKEKKITSLLLFITACQRRL